MLGSPEHALFFESLRNISSLPREVKILSHVGLGCWSGSESVVIQIVSPVVECSTIAFISIVKLETVRSVSSNWQAASIGLRLTGASIVR
jgi:hypothetical protein